MKSTKLVIKKRDVFNVATFFNLIRIILIPLVIYLIFSDLNRWWVVLVFAIAALSDALDGYSARKFNLVSEFGRRLDMIADRVFMISVVMAILIYFALDSMNYQILLVVMIMAREIIAAPVFLFSLLAGKGNPVPNARLIAKFTTLMQGITFPMIILGWQIAFYFAFITLVVGVASGFLYAFDCFSRNNVDIKKKN